MDHSDVALIFAYGTLRDPRRMDALLDASSRWRVVAEGSVQGRLYDVGEYPALIKSDDPNDRVPGVVIEIQPGASVLARLDAYEGVDAGFYRREVLPVYRAAGSARGAWVYVYQRSVEGLRRITEWPGTARKVGVAFD